MPAMNPSTTSRARTSRWASRATIAGSSQRRPSRSPGRTPPCPRAAPLAVPRVPNDAPGPRSLMRSLVPRRPRDVVALAERALARGCGDFRVARERGPSLPAREPRDAQQQLHLGLVDVAEAEAHARVPHDRAGGVQEFDPAAHAANLLDAVVFGAVVDAHAAALVRQLFQELLLPRP